MSLMDLFRTTPKTVAKPASPPIAPTFEAATTNSETAVAVLEAHVGPSPEELARIQRAEELAALRTEIDAEAIGIEALPAAYEAPHSPRSAQQVQHDINTTNTQLKSMQERHKAALGELLPVEEMLRIEMHKEHEKHSAAYSARLRNLNLELIDATLDAAYKRIDMAFMTRRKWSAKHECAMPLFAMFHIDKPLCTMEGHARHGRGLQKFVLSEPAILAKLVPETANMLQELCAKDLPEWTSRARCISSRFAGAIPAEVRTSIREARPKFEQIYIVTESPEWEMEAFEERTSEGVYTRLNPKPIPQRDPLVIGEKNGKFWLIAVFDTTPTEEYVAREFTSDRIANQ